MQLIDSASRLIGYTDMSVSGAKDLFSIILK